MSETTTKYTTERSMDLKHLPNHAVLLIQRQIGGPIPDESIQFGLPNYFINKDNGEKVWNVGPSIQLEQIPELMDMLMQTHEKYSREKLHERKSCKTITFANAIEK